MRFSNFQKAVEAQFKKMSGGELFRVNADKNDLWDTYLASFPEGSNPMYRQRTEHDCNCCKQFVRAVGDVVSIVNNKIVSIWDVTIKGEPEYQTVANGMAKMIKSKVIVDKFLHYEGTAGRARTIEQLENGTASWDHFFVNIPSNFVKASANIPSELSVIRSTKDVFLRALNEITDDAVDTLSEIIAQNSLYRGEEHKFSVTEFKKAKKNFASIPEADRSNYVWSIVGQTQGSVTNIRNSVIGTVLVDLSEGVDIETAIKKYEDKVAPANYKRPKALVTKAMIEKAKKKIEELGLSSALERRYATINDITINNLLFADRTTKAAISGDVFSEISTKVTPKKTFDKVEEVSIEKFISDILPRAEKLEVMFENGHVNNLVSLVAPEHVSANNLFKWDNGFSWSYNGDFADSIKERVKAAGGNVTGEFCCRLAWYNHNDLDFHMYEPCDHIYFRDKKSYSTGGCLDVDMNAGGGTTRTPVENIYYQSISRMQEGIYELKVNCFNNRDSKDDGFEVEVDILGETYNFTYDKRMSTSETITVAKFKYSKKDGLVLTSSLNSVKVSKKVWNIDTSNFVPVNAMMLSPNYWDEQGVGNKHYFFMLDGCKNDGVARGFYNEFLRQDLNEHRKVIEIVGSKMKTKESDNQLSGIGFSSTQKGSLLCRVSGAFTRVVKVVF